MLRFCLVCFALFSLPLLAGCQSESDAWERIQAMGVLRIGLDPTYPPFETIEGGELKGLDVDLIRALAADLGLEAEFVYFGYDGLYDALATGQVDVLISALVIAPERTRDFAYSEPYFNAGQVLISRADGVKIEAMGDLTGRTLAVELGAQGHVEATAWARRLPNLEIIPFNTPDEAMTAVAGGAADAALVDNIGVRLYLLQHPGLQASDSFVTDELFALVVRIEDGVLLSKLNDRLQQMKQNGRLAEITGRWLGQDARE